MVKGLDGLQFIVVRTGTGKRLPSTLTRAVKAKQESCKKRQDRDAIQWSGRGLAASIILAASTKNARMQLAGLESAR